MKQLKVNGVIKDVDVADGTPLLWVIRENLAMTGTKFGCGAGLCGAGLGQSLCGAGLCGAGLGLWVYESS